MLTDNLSFIQWHSQVIGIDRAPASARAHYAQDCMT